MTQRHVSVQHLVNLLVPNENLPPALLDISVKAAEFGNVMLYELEDGPELAAGLRKLLEAKDCFVRQALIDRKQIG